MTWFIKELFTASFLGSLTWLALGALRPLTGRMFSQTWHYRTGILPVLFLFGAAKAADPSARLLASLIDFMRNLQKPAEAINAAGTAVTRAAQGAGAAVLDPPLLDLNLAAGGMDIIGALSDNLNLFGTYLFAVWLVGCAAFLAVKAAAYIRLRRFLLAGAVPMTGCGAAPPVYLSSGTGAPMLLGVIKPLIILPYKDYNAEELAVVLAHERLHFKRGDMAVKFALLIANSMHWFNPLAYLINRTVSDFCETACDEALARHMNRAERMSYCEIILSAAEDGAYKRRAGKHAGEHSSPLRAGISAGENLKRRLGYMIKFKRTRLPAAILSAALSAALVFGGCVTALAMEKLDILGDGNEYFAPDYTVTDQNPDWMVQMEQERQANMDETAKRLVAINRAYQESYVSDPSEITMDEAAAIAVKAFTQFYRLDFGLGSKIYVSYVYPAPISAASPEVKIPRTVDVALLDKDGNLLPYDLDTLLFEPDPDSPTKWAVRYYIDGEDGAFWEYLAVLMASDGKLFSLSRYYKSPDGSQAARYNVSFDGITDNLSTGMIGGVGTSIEVYDENKANGYEYSKETGALIASMRGNNEYTRRAAGLAVRSGLMAEVETSECTELMEYFGPDASWEKAEITVKVTSTEGEEAALIFQADTKEFVEGRF